MKQLEVLITSGGTISKVDDVRHVGNFSGGMTGALIAEEFLKKGWKVHYVYGENAKRPILRNMTLEPYADFEKQIKKAREIRDEFKPYFNNLKEWPIITFEDYLYNVENILKSEHIDAVVLAAAVSDYSAVKQDGKISSDKDELNILMKRNPKVISLVKEWKPEVYLVGFKLLVGVSDDELIKTGYEHCIKNKADLTVANTLPVQTGKFTLKSSTFILDNKDLVLPVKRYELASRLAEIVNQNLKNPENHQIFRLSNFSEEEF